MVNLLEKATGCRLLVSKKRYWIKTKSDTGYWINPPKGLFGLRGVNPLLAFFRRWAFGDGALVFDVGVGFIPTRPGIALVIQGRGDIKSPSSDLCLPAFYQPDEAVNTRPKPELSNDAGSLA
jgi:hypothetical protein